jgi:hypothetical protein
MSTSLYVFFATEFQEAALPAVLRDLHVPGYSFSSHPIKHTIDAPNEPSVPTRCTFFAQDYFRIFLADQAIQFYREAPLPRDLATGAVRCSRDAAVRPSPMDCHR